MPPDSPSADEPVVAGKHDDDEGAPPLPNEAPPLPDEAPPLPAEAEENERNRHGEQVEEAANDEEAPPLPNEPGSSEAAPAHGWQASE